MRSCHLLLLSWALGCVGDTGGLPPKPGVDEDSGIGATAGCDTGAAATWYRDGDGDGYGDPAVPEAGCNPPTGYVSDTTDCDDADATVSPDAIESCDGVDEDCDGLVDEEA